ncbi:hypothetical protein L3Q82_016070 [Scortum barcoo]|uniref:Uncharacterized protein n=1 Tax=Scortum barcoo TaxID=214431 RepID=A0ACB8VRW8_9TELE|nr:hypothetical protein L3Q82_016070 [Scortum barcoo]
MPTTLSASEREMSGRPPSTPPLDTLNTSASSPRQARWALFLSRFEFTLTYRPGSHNTKPDALSRQFSLDTSPSEPASILPPSCIVGAASWDIETRVQEALKDHPAPNNCPKDRLFVPSNLRSLVLQWIHTSKFSCHPGIRRTLFLLQQRFWWPRMAQDTQEYINVCSVCARGKSSHRAPAGFLKPLPIPHRPWSHIAVDFVSGLPPSQGNTVILTVVDRFSKSVHFIPLPKLPSALETASLLTDHVFRLHGLPTDIVSDRGPQFTSQVWTAFCKALGATPSLSSGYHPQSNGQTELGQPEPGDRSPLRCCSRRTRLFPPSKPTSHEMPMSLASAVRAALVRSSTRSQKLANKLRRPAPDYLPGQKVWLSSRDLPLQVPSRKLAPRYIGPYVVEKIINGPSTPPPSVSSCLLLYGSTLPSTSPSSSHSLLVSFARPPTPLLPQLIDGHPAYSVKEVLDVRRRGRGYQYLVNWEGYGLEERSWISRKLILDNVLLRDFYSKHPDKPGSAARDTPKSVR